MYPTEEFLDPSLSGNSGEARLRAGEQIAAAEADGLTSMAGRHAKFGPVSYTHLTLPTKA